jgi:hypothetical protein
MVRVKALEREGLIRLVPSFDTSKRPLLYLPESFLGSCVEAVTARILEVAPESRFSWWKTGRVRKIDLLADIRPKRIGFCFCESWIPQNRNLLPLRIAQKLGVIHKGYLLHCGNRAFAAGPAVIGLPLTAFLSETRDWILRPTTRRETGMVLARINRSASAASCKSKDQEEDETCHGNGSVNEPEPLGRLLGRDINTEKKKTPQRRNDEENEQPLRYAPPQGIAESDGEGVRHDGSGPARHGKVDDCRMHGVAQELQSLHCLLDERDPQRLHYLMTYANRAFEVDLKPQPSDEFIARMSIDKKFRGDLEAESNGQMLSAATEVEGSAGYVAMERVSGTLRGRRGTFVLQHSGTMNRGKPHLIVSVVPDSGTGELVGLSGAMKIIIADGKHSYEFEYSLPR